MLACVYCDLMVTPDDTWLDFGLDARGERINRGICRWCRPINRPLSEADEESMYAHA